jgi:hypothetical protein
MHENEPKDSLKSFQPMRKVVEISDVVEGVLYLARADQVSGELLHVDDGVHAGRW